jgi:chorismate mutase
MGHHVEVTVRAIRGATQVKANTAEAIQDSTAALVQAVLSRNDLVSDDLISVWFTATPDLDADFPAHGARQVGLTDVPLLCCTEIPVPGALPMVVRLMAHIETERPRSELVHVYMDGAEVLRRDLVQ